MDISFVQSRMATGYLGTEEMKLFEVATEGLGLSGLKLWWPVTEQQNTDIPNTFIEGKDETAVYIKNTELNEK